MSDVCNDTCWDALADRTLIVDLTRHDCSMDPKIDPMPRDSALMVCPMEPSTRMPHDYHVRSSPIASKKARGLGAEVSDVASAGVQHQ